MSEDPPGMWHGAESPPAERAPRRMTELTPPAAEGRISVGDGFKFGCGFMMSAGIALLVGFLALSVGLLIASLIGVAPPWAGG